jgi:hypothetical protein
MKTPKKSSKTKTQGLSKSKKVKLSDLTPKKELKGGACRGASCQGPLSGGPTA